MNQRAEAAKEATHALEESKKEHCRHQTRVQDLKQDVSKLRMRRKELDSLEQIDAEQSLALENLKRAEMKTAKELSEAEGECEIAQGQADAAQVEADRAQGLVALDNVRADGEAMFSWLEEMNRQIEERTEAHRRLVKSLDGFRRSASPNATTSSTVWLVNHDDSQTALEGAGKALLQYRSALKGKAEYAARIRSDAAREAPDPSRGFGLPSPGRFPKSHDADAPNATDKMN